MRVAPFVLINLHPQQIVPTQPGRKVETVAERGGSGRILGMETRPEDQPMPWWVHATKALSPNPVSDEEMEAKWREFVAKRQDIAWGDLEPAGLISEAQAAELSATVDANQETAPLSHLETPASGS